MTTEHDAAPAVSDEARRLIKALRDAWQTKDAADRALTAYVAGLEAEVAQLRDVVTTAEVPRGLYLALADAAPGIWHGGHRCDGAITVGLPGDRASIGQDIPASDATAAAEAVNFVRRLDTAQRRCAAQETPHVQP